MNTESISYIKLERILNKENVDLLELIVVFMELLAVAGLPSEVKKFEKVAAAYEKIQQLVAIQDEIFLFKEVKETYPLLLLNAYEKQDMRELI